MSSLEEDPVFALVDETPEETPEGTVHEDHHTSGMARTRTEDDRSRPVE